MKAFLLASLLSFSALAVSQPAPLITKSSGGGGPVPAELTSGEMCYVYNNRAVIFRRLGSEKNTGLVTREVRNFWIEGSIRKVIELAEAEKIVETENGLCDGPATTITAGKKTLLFSTGGCGEPSKIRKGTYSERLRDIVNQFCATTYQPPHGN